MKPPKFWRYYWRRYALELEAGMRIAIPSPVDPQTMTRLPLVFEATKEQLDERATPEEAGRIVRLMREAAASGIYPGEKRRGMEDKTRDRYKGKKQCRSCYWWQYRDRIGGMGFHEGRHSCRFDEYQENPDNERQAVGAWQDGQQWRYLSYGLYLVPRADADGCPGWKWWRGCARRTPA